MLKCFFCDNNADYMLYSQKAFVCDKCINDKDKKLANKFEYHTISKLDSSDLTNAEIIIENIPYIKEDNLLFSLYDFEILHPSIFYYMSKIKEIQVENTIHIIFFPNKKKSNDFTKKFINVNLANSYYSRYTFFHIPTSFYALINVESTKVEDLEFILKLLDSQIKLVNKNFFNERDFSNNIKLLYKNILSTYTKKLGFLDNIYYNEDESFFLQIKQDFIRLRDEFFALKNMPEKNKNEIDEFIHKKIGVTFIDEVNELFSKSPTFYNMFDLIFIFGGYGILTSLSKTPSNFFTLFDSKIDAMDWWGHIEIATYFKEYKDKLSERFISCNSEDEFIQILIEETNYLTNKLPPIFLRYTDIFLLGKTELNLEIDLNYLGKYYLYNKEIALSITYFLMISYNIIEKCKNYNPAMTYFAYHLRELLGNKIIYSDPDKYKFLERYNETMELIEYANKNMGPINKILHEISNNKLDINSELVQIYDSLIELSFYMEDFKKMDELKKIIYDRYLNNDNIDLSLKLYLLSKDFINQEEYSTLNDIYRYGINFQPTKEEGYEGIIKIFAEAFFENKDTNKKNFLYEKALDLLDKKNVSILDLHRSFISDEFLKNLLNTYYHIEKSLQIEDQNSILNEIKVASDYAKRLVIDKFKSHHISYYYYYKTMLLFEMVTSKDNKKINEYMGSIKIFKFEKSIKYQEAIFSLLELLNRDLNLKIIYLLNSQNSDDLWIRALTHFIKKDIECKFYEDFKEYYNRENLNLSSNKDFSNIVFKTIHDFAYYCRQHSESFTKLNENSIRDLYLVIIKNIFSFSEGEAFNFDGKTDFKIINPLDKYEYIIGELKWWNSEEDVIEVFNQAVRKHSTGQEKEVYLIILNRNKDIKSVCEKVIKILSNQKELIEVYNKNISPQSSKEYFMKCLVNIKGDKVPLILGFINLYHEKF